MNQPRTHLEPLPRDLTGKSVLVLGLGASGEWAARLAHSKGARVLVADDGEPGKAAARLGGLQHVVAQFYFGDETAKAPLTDLLVLSPGVNPAHPLAGRQAAAGRAVLPEIEFADHYAPAGALRVGITGTNGKSTTTSLIGHLLQRAGRRVAIGGNLGEPYAKLVMQQPDAEIYVLELSSFQLETTQHFHVNVGVYLNLTPDHLDRHVTLAAYADAKAKLFARQTENDYAIHNADDESACVAALGSPAARLPFSTARQIPGGGYYVADTGYGRDERLFDFTRLRLIGAPNRQNAIAGALAALACGVKPWEIAPAMESFYPLPHRLETVATVRGVRMINDSKGTNVDATLGAVRGLPPPLVVILGGRDKDQDFSPLLEPLRERARKVVLYGEAAAKIASALAQLQPLRSGPLAEAVDLALDCAQPGDVLLFSPACASFDQFRNFEHRGEVFRALACQAVQRLGGTVEAVRP